MNTNCSDGIQGGNQRVNSKQQQAAAGNWGHPRPYTKKHTNIPELTDVTKHKKKAKKKKNKDKNPHLWVFDVCPFCGEELRKVKSKDNSDRKRLSLYFGRDRERKCRNCGAKNTGNVCPACKTDKHGIWKNKEGIYKHASYGCGFVGKKKVKKKGKKNVKKIIK